MTSSQPESTVPDLAAIWAEARRLHPIYSELAREFAIDPSGRYILIANQHSNHIVVMRRDPIPQMRLYTDWLSQHRGLDFASYDDLWRWSVDDLEAFWGSIWDYHAVCSPTPYTRVLADDDQSDPEPPLGRATEWVVGADGEDHPVGQRLWSTDSDLEIGILDFTDLQLV